MTKFIPFIMTDNAKEALDFYSKVFDGKIADIHYADSIPEVKDTALAAKTIIHGVLSFDNDQTVFVSDSIKPEPVFPGGGETTSYGNNVQIAISYDNEDELRAVYDKLIVDGRAILEPQHSFWGSIYAQLEDKFKVTWHLDCQE